jgi:hypothetical protein
MTPASDVFLSHASEDKDAIARPLQLALEERNVSVWFDEIKIKVGQSIRRRASLPNSGHKPNSTVCSAER